MKILVTGASGLLGSAITRRFASNHEILALAHNNVMPWMKKIDLFDRSEITALESETWDVLIHCAAFRDPDFCETSPELAHRLNCEASALLAESAKRRSAKIVHISTDYVFDGSTPPYKEDDPTLPVNCYGQTKLYAEQTVRAIDPDSIILRIPVLYGNAPYPVVSGYLENSIKLLNAGQATQIDDSIARYPTNIDDVADVIEFLLQIDFSGTIHASSSQRTTNYGWTLAIANVLGIEPSFITKAQVAQTRKAVRPLDSQLSTDKLKSLGGPLPRGYSEVLPTLNRVREIIDSD